VYGGAGMIISRGLGDLLAKNVDAFQKCVKTKYPAEFGDRAFTGCLWELGIAPTDPGPFLLGTSSEPLFGTFQRGNPGVPIRFLDDVKIHSNRDSTYRRALSTLLTWHAKAGSPGRRLADVIADIKAFVDLMASITNE
jgi:hypothetical protein